MFVKVVVTGPVAAGKTTFITALSDIPPVLTEKAVTDETRVLKSQTTVSMDFGKIVVTDDAGTVALYLFGTPGQERFDFMWDVLARGMLGFVLMIDVSSEVGIRDARQILRHFTGLGPVPFVIGANRTEKSPESLKNLPVRLGVDPCTPVVECDPRDRESAKAVLLTLLYLVLDHTGTVP